MSMREFLTNAGFTPDEIDELLRFLPYEDDDVVLPYDTLVWIFSEEMDARGYAPRQQLIAAE